MLQIAGGAIITVTMHQFTAEQIDLDANPRADRQDDR